MILHIVESVIIIKVIAVFILNVSCKCVCNKPAKSNNLVIIDLDVNKTSNSNMSYPCGKVIHYKCKSNFSLMIGNNVSHCVQGNWNSSVPSCGQFHSI